ncbi:MAG: aconitate hydratase AcnA [Rhodospirillales bacterium]|jgi:aconitate hydratase|nr:aconitate hydratase AcnA [Rhodospirillales bacterium]MBT4040344.1 aconitate hydratase AcnA [Rhodospirillales bacterium]MBT4625071.1 aconitate hydratase AcnA [Rhodospirillales bacterium]MBT5353200.1 aconitate hydratase AcnA [Rhodospirillales bacterium]MBT5519378.1 aconitate hydratase AcnA [Rhodospirillales bacterium]
MPITGQDTLGTRRTLSVGGNSYDYFSLTAAQDAGLGDVSRLPKSLKVLLENLLRYEDGRSVVVDDVKACAAWLEKRTSTHEIAYRPARVLMQDFTGVPAVVDLAAMRDAMTNVGGDPQKINPLSTCNLVIDHSVMVDEAGSAGSLATNIEKEFERNGERYTFLKWGQGAFDNFTVVPPGTGICHQVNLEFLAKSVWTQTDDDGKNIAMPDTLVGTDSHTTMVNGMAVLGWGVGGIEAEAAMLGQPVSMIIPEVIGFKLTGSMKEGNTATDLVLVVVEMLRAKGVVGKFVEFYGDGLDNLSLADRATIANMAPEYGATCGFFPIDDETLNYLNATARDPGTVALVEAYAKEQGLWRTPGEEDPVFTDTMELDMGTVEPCISGPKRPQDRILLADGNESFAATLKDMAGRDAPKEIPVDGSDHGLRDGDVVIAAITSCTNTSNPSVMVAAGLLARNAAAKGLQKKPWVKTSLAPGSQVVADYLEKAGLQDPLDAMGFNIVGFGCTTCIGNSGPLDKPISDAIEAGDLVATAALSGNRNFEGRISPHVRANYLASPPLVVAYAIAGSMTRDLFNDPLGKDSDGNPVYLKDIWPSNKEVADTVQSCLGADMFAARYGNVYEGPPEWQAIGGTGGRTFDWDDSSTYVKNPPYFDGMSAEPEEVSDVVAARPLLILADSVTTDHISPAGAIKKDSPAGEYLLGYQVRPEDFNSYGSRRGNHEIMMRGTFANIRIRNEMLDNIEGGVTKHMPSGEQMAVYDAAMKYADEGTSLVVVGGKEYGSGSSRDWAAKGTRLLGVKAVIVESFERIHRSNLVGMGVLPLQFKNGESRESLKLDGTETYDITGVAAGLKPRMDLDLKITRADGSSVETQVLCRIDTEDEVDYYRHGGILHYVLRQLMAS